jgi:hypothetical protein
LLRDYLKFFRYFRKDMDYRQRLIGFITDNGFFWHVLIAHAWILHSQFHIDAGRQGDMKFYANAVNQNANWSDLSSLNTSNPYDAVEAWRAGTKAGHLVPATRRAFGRLMDDDWQRILFTQGVPDLPLDVLAGLMANIAASGDGRLHQIETEFYQGLARLSAQHPPDASAAA